MSASNSVVKKRTRATYSDLPIQVAERQVSQSEIIDEIVNQSSSRAIIQILNNLLQYRENLNQIKDESYSFNEILKKGSVYLTLEKKQVLESIFVGLNSMQFVSAIIMIEEEVSFDLVPEGGTIKVENHEGIFAILSDGKRRIKTAVSRIILQDNIDGGITILVDCRNPYSNSGMNEYLQLLVVTEAEARADKLTANQISKKNSLKQFRQTYARLDSLNSTAPCQSNIFSQIKSWFSKRGFDFTKN